MRFQSLSVALTLALLAITSTTAWAVKNNEIEATIGWYFPGDFELEGLGTNIKYHDTSTYGVGYGYRFSPLWGVGASWTHVEMDAARTDQEHLNCSTCDFNTDFFDFSVDWYPGGHNWALYGGIGWVTAVFSINIPGDSNDRSFSDDTFTYHIGTSWTWNVGESFYIRPDVRLRFFDLDSSARGKYDSEDPEIRLGFGWRF